MKISKLTAALGVAGMLSAGLATTAAAVAPVPSAGARAGGGDAPASSSRNTYINEHGSDGDSRVKLFPRTFFLVEGAYDIFSIPVFWTRINLAKGPMYAISEDGHKSYIGNVPMLFSRRLCNAHFIGTGRGYCYWENVRLSGILPGNGGSVQNWHWSWRADNWVNNR